MLVIDMLEITTEEAFIPTIKKLKGAIKMENNNHLTTEAYKEMASEISDVTEDLKLIRHTLELVRTPREVNKNGHYEVEYYKVHQYLEVLFSKVQGLISDLDHIGGTLYGVDDLEELKGFVKDEWIKEVEQVGADEL